LSAQGTTRQTGIPETSRQRQFYYDTFVAFLTSSNPPTTSSYFVAYNPPPAPTKATSVQSTPNSATETTSFHKPPNCVCVCVDETGREKPKTDIKKCV